MPFLSFQVMTCIGQRQSVATAAFARLRSSLALSRPFRLSGPGPLLTPGGHLGRWIARCDPRKAFIWAGCGKRSEQSQNCSNQRYTQEQASPIEKTGLRAYCGLPPTMHS